VTACACSGAVAETPSAAPPWSPANTTTPTRPIAFASPTPRAPATQTAPPASPPSRPPGARRKPRAPAHPPSHRAHAAGDQGESWSFMVIAYLHPGRGTARMVVGYPDAPYRLEFDLSNPFGR